MSTTGATADSEAVAGGGEAAGALGAMLRAATAGAATCVVAVLVIVRVLAWTGLAAVTCLAGAAFRAGAAAADVSVALLVSVVSGAVVLVSAGAGSAGVASVVGAGWLVAGAGFVGTGCTS